MSNDKIRAAFKAHQVQHGDYVDKSPGGHLFSTAWPAFKAGWQAATHSALTLAAGVCLDEQRLYTSDAGRQACSACAANIREVRDEQQA